MGATSGVLSNPSLSTEKGGEKGAQVKEEAKSRDAERFGLTIGPGAGIQKMQEEIALLEKKTELMHGLPFLHGWKFYPWAREFFESVNKLNLLCAANQISKSSTQIRKCIDWATDKEKWPRLWARKPTQFWYLYPSQEVVDIEFKLKWSQFLPRGRFKEDPVYGWKELRDSGHTVGIEFFSGVFVFFKTYTKNISHLQSGTCDSIFTDEELPLNIYDELIMRLNATDGYFHMVFTATLGQDFWRQVMEPKESEDELLPTAAKWTVSLYEALFYEDGTRSHWTEERISAIIAKCKSQAEVNKRVFGRFVVTEGRKYPTFDASKHMKEKHPIPHDWNVYCGVDPGSGGEEGHPAAIAFIAVRPDYRAARLVSCWRGDKIETTNSMIVLQYREMKEKIKLNHIAAYYDWANKDLEITARGLGETFLKAEKSHEKGEGILNVLFKHDMLFFYTDEESAKAASEFSVLRENTPKRKAKDDLIDAIRYACSNIPFDFSWIVGMASEIVDTPEKPMNHSEREVAERRKAFEETDVEYQRVQDEFDEWNERY